ncbi:MAG: putative selenium-dependent hydroxylase accessory protein YqeC, partial [Anaerolineae bacterium]|nr:putative selenium-dependent hydroxylase accessory protein YqeC [Anaerolineae bacterium]
MQLITSLRYNQPFAIAFVGAGGKSTAIFTAAKQLLTAGRQVPSQKTVLLTTSTHFSAWQADQADHHLIFVNEEDVRNLRKNLPSGIVLLTGKRDSNLLGGLSQRLLDDLHQLAESQQLPLLIEADGSHMHPLKAPAEHEPAIPGFSQVVVVT